MYRDAIGSSQFSPLPVGRKAQIGERRLARLGAVEVEGRGFARDIGTNEGRPVGIERRLRFSPTFERKAERGGLTEEDIQNIAAKLAAKPTSGDLMKGTGGLRKLRFPRAGEGKSGGYRTIHYFAGEDVPIFLLDLIDKREKANLSPAERNAIAKALLLLVADFRERKK